MATDSTEAPPIRVLIVVSGAGEQEAESFAIARLLRDAGMEVIYGGDFSSAENVAKIAMEEDVAVVGLAAESSDVLEETSELVALLQESDPPIELIVGGSVVGRSEDEVAEEAGAEEAVSDDAPAEEVAATFRRLARPPEAGS